MTKLSILVEFESDMKRPVPGPTSCLRASCVQSLKVRDVIMGVSETVEIPSCGGISG